MTDSGWRKRQIALDKKAENARELGLDYDIHSCSPFCTRPMCVREAVQAEREACAGIAEKQRYATPIALTSNPAQNGAAVAIANAIRARGQA